jgi:hypothetical protein
MEANCPRCRLLRLRRIDQLPKILMGLTLDALARRLRFGEGGGSLQWKATEGWQWLSAHRTVWTGRWLAVLLRVVVAAVSHNAFDNFSSAANYADTVRSDHFFFRCSRFVAVRSMRRAAPIGRHTPMTTHGLGFRIAAIATPNPSTLQCPLLEAGATCLSWLTASCYSQCPRKRSP